ncbi:putative DUF2189 domain-containing protein [Azospirillaceae bacterium]
MPAIRTVEPQRSRGWLRAGWDDVSQASSVSLSYGGWVVFACFLLLFGVIRAGYLSLVFPVLAGLILAAPFLMVGCYPISLCFERKQPATLEAVTEMVRLRGRALGVLGGLTAVVFVVWIWGSLALYALHFSGAEAILRGASWSVLTSFFVSELVFGWILYMGIFALTAISLPFLVERGGDWREAVAVSWAVVRRNPWTMTVWGAWVAMFVMSGVLTAVFGLAMALPLVGYASWRAYRDLVGP